jgi:hypothetical protein
MKMNLLLPLLLALPLAAAPALAADPKKPAAKKAEAADAKKKKPAPAPKKQRTDMVEEETVALFKPYDTNGDFEIDIEEFKAIEAEFKKHPKGPLKSFDKANDGALDAMIDRTGINVKLGAAAPKTKPAAKAPSKKPAPAPAKKPAPEQKPG